MLVLSRRINESIQIGEDIRIFIIDVRGDVVRVGIDAPQKTQIWRKELWDAIVEENRQAAKAAQKPEVSDMPQLPVSAFSKLPKLKTVRAKKRQGEELTGNGNDRA
jgi:carbon storage regulator